MRERPGDEIFANKASGGRQIPQMPGWLFERLTLRVLLFGGVSFFEPSPEIINGGRIWRAFRKERPELQNWLFDKLRLFWALHLP